MPQDPFRQVNGPQGPINFPASMNDEQVTQVMRKLYPPKQYLPEVNQAISTIPKPGLLEDKSFWSDKPGDYIPVGRQFLGPDMKPIQRRPTPEWSGVRGPGQIAAGVEQTAEGTKADVYQGLSKTVGGAFETATPVMLAGAVASPAGAVKAVAGGIAGQYAGQYSSRALGGSPEAQEFWGTVGSVLGAGAGAAREFVKSRYLQAVENTKGDLRASRPAGGSVDEVQLQKAAEAKVQVDIAKGNTLPELGKDLAHQVIAVAQAGTFTTPSEHLTQQFGKHAEATPIEAKPAPSAAEIQSRALATLTPPELKPKVEVATRPVTPVERVEQIAKKVAPPEAPTVKEPSVQERVEGIKAAAAPKPDPAAELAELRAQRTQEVVDLKAMVAERRAQNPKAAAEWDVGAPPKNATHLQQKQAAMKARQLPITQKQEQMEQFVQEHREANAKQLTDLQNENAQLRSKAPVSPEVGREAAPPEAPKSKPVQAAAPERSGEPVRPAAKPALNKALWTDAFHDRLKQLGATPDEIRSFYKSEVAADFYDKAVAAGKTPQLDHAILLADHWAKQDVLPPAKNRPEELRQATLGQIKEDAKTIEGQKVEPRSVRGDLGERPSAKASPVDFQKRMEIYKQRVEAAMADPKNKGVPKSEIQRRVSEKMKGEQGFAKMDWFGGSRRGGENEVQRRVRVQSSLEDSGKPNVDAWHDARNLISPKGEAFRIGNLDHDDFMQKHKMADFRGPYFEGGEGESGYLSKGWIRKATVGEYAADLSQGRSVVSNLSRAIMVDLKNGQQYFRIDHGPKTYEFSAVDFLAYKSNLRNMLSDFRRTSTGLFELKGSIRSDYGAFGGGGPEDIRARREAKINDWIKQLRDEKSTPEVLDTAWKQLQAYGLDHNEIIRRVSGAEGFAIDPHDALAKAERERESLEERLGPNADLDAKADSLIGGLIDSVDKVLGNSEMKDFYFKEIAAHISGQPEELRTFSRLMEDPNNKHNLLATSPEHRQEMFDTWLANQGGVGKVGDPDIGSVQSSDVQELNRMFNLRDERGFWRMMPKKKVAPKGPGTGTALDDLTRQMEASMKAVPPNDSRMKFAERLNKTMTEGWDSVQLSLGKIAAQSVALKDAYMRPPEQTDYHSAIGRFSGSLNRSAWELRQFTKEIKAKLPDERQREAITNWLQADGNDQVLAQRAAASKGSVRAGYERARTLTQEEIGYAKMYEAHFDRRLKEAIQLGILDHGIDNYVPQIWKPKDQQSMSNHFSSLTRSGLLKPDFNSAKRRIFDSYFEGEQAGRKPVSKDIGMLVASWERAFNQAVASRNLIKDLSRGTASDGRPIVAPSGGVKTVYDPTSNTADPDVSAHLIYPKATPDETGDYRAVNHPAMTKWNWVGKDPDGNPMYLKGDLRVHPEFYKKLDNTINRGKWAGDHPVQSAILKGQGFFKATLLSASPFHQVQEGVHAIFHGVNPFNPPQIDLANPVMGKLLDRGLVIGNYDPVAAFDEGLTSGMGGAVGKIPGLGRFMQKYSDYLFSDYIPRLKGAMATEAYERNMKRFQGALANGSITSDHIAEITANQANAAFGELNYITLGRNPQTQAIMRMMFLAPDFLEARTRFAGQALTPFGREQQVALVRGALGMYMGARVLNKIMDDDYHWDRPFSLVSGGYEYKMRSLPGDIANLIKDPHSFVMHRLSFIPRAGMEFVTGKDEFGRKRDLGEQTWDFIRGTAPIPSQGLFKSGNRDNLGGAMGMLGITRSKYRTEAASMAHEFAIGSNNNDVTSHHIAQMVQDISDGHFNGKEAREMVHAGKMNPQDILKAAELAALPELWRDYRNLPVELKAKIWKVATPKERAILTSYAHKELDTTRLLPEQRAEFMNSFAHK